MKRVLPDWIVLSVWRALLGEIYPSIRAIAVAFSDDQVLVIRYYLDRVPTEMDYESMEVVATNVSASTGTISIKRVDLDCQYSTIPIGQLDGLDGYVYCRREYED